MLNVAYPVICHVGRNWGKSALVIFALAVVITGPLSIRQVVRASADAWIDRAEEVPLALGTRGSRSDLALHVLYFFPLAEASLVMGDLGPIEESGHADTVPMYIRHTAHGFPIVGTTLDYFALRELPVSEGRSFAVLGECIVGDRVARRLGLTPGDSIVSDLQNAFDLDAGDPLLLNVAGILKRTNSPDDHAIFVDVKTAWIISGIGHGHEEVLPDGEGDTAGALTVLHEDARFYQEITPENIETFHFHEEEGALPLTAAIVFPHDERASAILRGRYDSSRNPLQMLVPSSVMDEMVGRMQERQQLVMGIMAASVVLTMLLLVAVMMLSLRLRRSEFVLLHLLGCSRGRLLAFVSLEWVAYILVAGLLSMAILSLLGLATPPLAKALL